MKDIVERCAINRNTFYYYFQDMAALAEAVAEEEFLPLPEESLSLNTVEDTLNAVISRTLEHRQAALKIYHSANRERFELSMWRISQHVVGQFLNAILKDRTILPDDRAFLQNYQRSVLFGMTMDWLQQGLDPLARIHFRNLLRRLRDRGKSIFFSSHELGETELLCDSVAIMKRGRCIYHGPVDRLAGDGRGNLERLFLDVLEKGGVA